MIKVSITKNQQELRHVTITGHAQSDEPGKDLVCAGVSAVGIGVCNTIAKKGYIDNSMCQVIVESGRIDIAVKESDQTLQVILETLEISLQSFLRKHNDYVQIFYEEE